MKKILFPIMVSFLLAQHVFSQCCDREHANLYFQDHYSPLPANFTPTMLSITETVNGFDNFRLGVGFAEPYIATNPNNPLNSVCAFMSGKVYYTVDGVNWNFTNANPANNGSDPFLCFDGAGTLYYSYLLGIELGGRISRSTDQGASWTNYPLFPNMDKSSILAVQTGGPFGNYLFAVWHFIVNNSISEVRLSKSINGAVNWSQPVKVNQTDDSFCSWLASGPNGSIPGGNLYIGYMSGIVGSDSLAVFVRRTTDAGATFLNETPVAKYRGPRGDTCTRLKNCIVIANGCIQMAADNSSGSNRGNVYIVYAAKPSSADNADVFLVRSTNYGDSWSVPRRVNDDFTNTDQWMPSLSVDNNTGKIFISWYDSRVDAANNLQTKLFGTVSTDGGLSFTPNSPISTNSFNPQIIAQMLYGNIGDYNGVSPVFNTSYSAWTDGRNNDIGCYTAYYPDFAMTADPQIVNMGSNDSVNILVKIPAVNGPFNEGVRFTASLDTLPFSGNISYNFIGRDSINSIPDSLFIKIRTSGVTVPRLHRLFVKANASGNGAPAHWRTINLLVNSSFLTVGTNRNGAAQFKVNNILYNTLQQLPFVNGSNVTLQALSPFNVGANKRYVYTNWSNGGDTMHSITVNSNTNLTAFYKTQYKFTLSSSIGYTFGSTGFYDSLQQYYFGVLARNVNYNGQNYRFRGWVGTGNGSYTSPDSSGNDTAVSVFLNSPIVEVARWEQLIGIIKVDGEIPKVYKLYQNYPNPFNPITVFKIDLPAESLTRLTVYDVLGREIETLINGNFKPGSYRVEWDGNKYSSGIYFYKVEAGDFVSIKKMVLLK